MSIRLRRRCQLFCVSLALVYPASSNAQDAKKTDKPVVVRNENPKPVAVPAGDGWESMFNGNDLSGWTQRNGWATYRVVDGTIVGTTAKDSPNSFLCSDKEFSDFELRFKVKVDNQLNSGVQIRSKSIKERDNGRVHGPQVEIEASPGESGYVYGESTGRNWISPTQPPHDKLKNGEWNEYHVRAQGKRIQTWINGSMIEDITDSESFDSGFIGLQVHGIGANEGPYQVSWKDIEIHEIKK